jgi:RNA polymerase sigma-70 factor (ECF subfamily)
MQERYATGPPRQKALAPIRTRSRVRIRVAACYQWNMTTTTVAALDLDRAFAEYRGELRGYCARLLGSASDADDAVQDTLVRGWRHIDRFEGRSSLRSWLYRIATNVCHDMRRSRVRRADVVDRAERELVVLAEDPAEVAVERDAVRRAFVAALSQLPPRQRAVVILTDVLRWEATEVAVLLQTTPTAVHSMHQRARATLSDRRHGSGHVASVDDELLARFVDAFEQYDVSALASLLRDAA